MYKEKLKTFAQITMNCGLISFIENFLDNPKVTEDHCFYFILANEIPIKLEDKDPIYSEAVKKHNKTI